MTRKLPDNLKLPSERSNRCWVEREDSHQRTVAGFWAFVIISRWFLVPKMFAISKNIARFPQVIACQKSLPLARNGRIHPLQSGGTNNINHSGERHPSFSRTFYTPKLYLRNAEEIILRKYMIIHVKVHTPISVFPPTRTEHHMVDF